MKADVSIVEFKDILEVLPVSQMVNTNEVGACFQDL